MIFLYESKEALKKSAQMLVAHWIFDLSENLLIEYASAIEIGAHPGESPGFYCHLIIKLPWKK